LLVQGQPDPAHHLLRPPSCLLRSFPVGRPARQNHEVVRIDSLSITSPGLLQFACLNQGSFAPPALPGFLATVTLSDAQASRCPFDTVRSYR
jgi:hypothetical protein